MSLTRDLDLIIEGKIESKRDDRKILKILVEKLKNSFGKLFGELFPSADKIADQHNMIANVRIRG